MQKPLALLLYEKLVPGSLLINRLQDLNYRVQTINDAKQLAGVAGTEGPMLILADMDCASGDVARIIGELHQNPATSHIPVIAYAQEGGSQLAAAQQAGAKLVVVSTSILAHLPQLLAQALQVD